MDKCQSSIRRIKMSIAAIFTLFLIYGSVVISAYFINSTATENSIPRSMSDEPLSKGGHDHRGLYVVLLACASIGLPLGLYVLSTLHRCKDELAKN
jgi:hypothetical protein